MTSLKLIWPHKKKGHKGQNGKVLIIGGSKDYPGAITLASLACFRTGVDYVTVATTEKVAWTINSLTPDIVTVKLKGDYLSLKHINKIVKLSKDYDVVLIGNGITLKSRSFVKNIIKKIKKPIVIDADAIKVLSLDDVDNAIFTPHMIEFEMLLCNSGILKYKNNENKFNLKNNNLKLINKDLIKKLQNKLKNNIILLKGPNDLIISKNKIKTNKTGNEAMTKAGTGDVLAGITAGILAQSKNLFKSAVLAAKINGQIGDRLKKKRKYAFIASDIADEIKRFK